MNKIQKFSFAFCLNVFILGMYSYSGGGKVQRRLCQLESGSIKKKNALFFNIFSSVLHEMYNRTNKSFPRSDFL